MGKTPLARSVFCIRRRRVFLYALKIKVELTFRCVGLILWRNYLTITTIISHNSQKRWSRVSHTQFTRQNVPTSDGSDPVSIVPVTFRVDRMIHIPRVLITYMFFINEPFNVVFDLYTFSSSNPYAFAPLNVQRIRTLRILRACLSTLIGTPTDRLPHV